MLKLNQLTGFGGGKRESPYLYDIIVELGLTANLNMVLDAADTRSYDGSSQTWTDVTGNGNNYFRGSTGSAAGDDPTFVGSAGVASEGTYFSTDGGDRFVNTATQTFVDTWYRDNGQASMFILGYPVTGTLQNWFSVQNSQTFSLMLATTAAVRVTHVVNNSGSTANENGDVVTSGAWQTFGFSFDEAASTRLISNGVGTNSFTTSSSATNGRVDPNNRIWDGPSGFATSGQRIACIAAWSTPLTDANHLAIHTALKARRSPSLP